MDDNNAVYPDSMDWCYNTKRKYLKIFEEQWIIKKIWKLYFANPLFYFYEDWVYPQVIDLFAKTNKEKFWITKL